MAKKKRPAKAPAIGKNEQRVLDKLRNQALEALDRGHYTEYRDLMRRYGKRKRSYENKAAWREGIRW